MIDADLAKSIRLVGLDVDGVMTNGGIYLGAVDGAPLEFKRYEIQDGLGVSLMRLAGLRVAVVTGRVSDSVRLRGMELGLEDVVQSPDGYKLEGFLGIAARHGIPLEHTAFLGDDFPDLSILRLVGLPVCVGNAVPEIRRECKVHLQRRGGHGAVREFAELLLNSRGEWDATWKRYVAARSQPANAAP